MSFVARLRPELIAVAPPWHTFDETVAGLTDAVDRAGLLPRTARAGAIAALAAREAEASTALLDIGVGIPHARLAALARPAVALALAARGLYEAVPTVSIRIVALVLSPSSANADHLRILSGIATLLRSPDVRADVLAAPDAAAALA